MESITIMLGIILLVFGILQIILFFKLWGMTNDVNKIKSHLCIDKEASLIREIIKGNPDIANILFDVVFLEMSKAYINGDESQYVAIVEEYKPFYNKAGVKFPKVLESIKTDADWAELVNFQ